MQGLSYYLRGFRHSRRNWPRSLPRVHSNCWRCAAITRTCDIGWKRGPYQWQSCRARRNCRPELRHLGPLQIGLSESFKWSHLKTLDAWLTRRPSTSKTKRRASIRSRAYSVLFPFLDCAVGIQRIAVHWTHHENLLEVVWVYVRLRKKAICHVIWSKFAEFARRFFRAVLRADQEWRSAESSSLVQDLKMLRYVHIKAIGSKATSSRVPPSFVLRLNEYWPS